MSNRLQMETRAAAGSRLSTSPKVANLTHGHRKDASCMLENPTATDPKARERSPPACKAASSPHVQGLGWTGPICSKGDGALEAGAGACAVGRNEGVPAASAPLPCAVRDSSAGAGTVTWLAAAEADLRATFKSGVGRCRL